MIAFTGLRVGEALALRWLDVDFDVSCLRVSATLSKIGGELVRTEPKSSRSSRTIPTPTVLVDELKRHRKHQIAERLTVGDAWHEQGLVFTTAIGTPRDYHNERRKLKTVMAGLSLRGSFHVFRHSAATTLIAEGVPITTVSSILGHSRTSTTLDVYAHVVPAATGAAINVLAERYRGGS